MHILCCFLVFLLISPLAYAGEEKKTSKQQHDVLLSCLTSDIRLWAPREDHNRMCATLRLKSLMPLAPAGWKIEDIEWIYKFSSEELGFREEREVESLFAQYKGYPFIRYREIQGKGQIIVMATIEAKEMATQQQRFEKFLMQVSGVSARRANGTVHYVEDKQKPSPFMAEKPLQVGYVSIKDRVFLVFYGEYVKDTALIPFLVRSIDSEAINASIGNYHE